MSLPSVGALTPLVEGRGLLLCVFLTQGPPLEHFDPHPSRSPSRLETQSVDPVLEVWVPSRLVGTYSPQQIRTGPDRGGIGRHRPQISGTSLSPTKVCTHTASGVGGRGFTSQSVRTGATGVGVGRVAQDRGPPDLAGRVLSFPHTCDSRSPSTVAGKDRTTDVIRDVDLVNGSSE